MKTVGWIALDIDGTITQERYSVPVHVVDYLRTLVSGRWKLALATGRSSTFALRALSSFDFPYVLLAQNGSAALQMPNQKEIFTVYLQGSVLEKVLPLCKNVLVYSGYEKRDACHWVPKDFTSDERQYVQDLVQREGIELKEGFPQSFPLIKCFGLESEMERIAQALQGEPLHICKIRDPFKKLSAVLLITEACATKGQSLRRLVDSGEKVIAAGDDENDLSLLAAADIKIAMDKAPDCLKKQADVIAKEGIVQALKEVLCSLTI